MLSLKLLPLDWMVSTDCFTFALLIDLDFINLQVRFSVCACVYSFWYSFCLLPVYKGCSPFFIKFLINYYLKNIVEAYFVTTESRNF